MVTCRVCQALIDISGKKDQHVVKCAECHEATVSLLLSSHNILVIFAHSNFFHFYQANKECPSWEKICKVPLQLSLNM